MEHKYANYNSEASAYDETRFSSKIGQHLDSMHKKIVSEFLPITDKIILDAGVGTGRFALWLLDNKFHVVGVDLSKDMLISFKNKAPKNNRESDLILADIRELPFRNNIFDSCISINVIDHIPQIESFINNARRVISKNGFFIFNFSNLQSPYLPIALIINIKNKAFNKSGIFSRWFTYKVCKKILSDNNFRIKKIRGCMIASNVPFGDKLLSIVKKINYLCEKSKLKKYCGSIFIKAF